MTLNVYFERFYHRYTDVSNWERVDIVRQDGDMLLQWECMGTGSMRGMISRGIGDNVVFIEVVRAALPGEHINTTIRIPHAGKCLGIRLIGGREEELPS